MTSGSASPLARVRPGLWAGATVGLLTGLCYILVFGGLDFSQGNPMASLLTIRPGMLALWAALVVAGACVGAFVSLRTSDE